METPLPYDFQAPNSPPVGGCFHSLRGAWLKENCSDNIITDGYILPFIALIHPIQWTIAYPVGADRPAKRQKKTSCVATSWPVRSTVHSPDGASYFLPV